MLIVPYQNALYVYISCESSMVALDTTDRQDYHLFPLLTCYHSHHVLVLKVSPTHSMCTKMSLPGAFAMVIVICLLFHLNGIKITLILYLMI